MLDLQQNPQHYEGYARVNANAPTRLTVSTFLASISFSTFAVFLSTGIQLRGDNPDTILIAISEAFLGAASVLFLAVSIIMSIVMTRFGGLSYNVRKSLEQGTSISLSAYEETALVKAIDLYDHSINIMYLGIIIILFSLLLLGFHVHFIIGATIAFAFLAVVIHFRKFLRFIIGK